MDYVFSSYHSCALCISKCNTYMYMHCKRCWKKWNYMYRIIIEKVNVTFFILSSLCFAIVCMNHNNKQNY